MSKQVAMLSIAIALAAGGAAHPNVSEAGTMPARAGKSDFPPEAFCWGVFGPTVANGCPTPKWWYMPLPPANAGSFWVWVTAQGASNANNVECFTTGGYRDGTIYVSEPYALPQFGPARDLQMPIWIPSGGTGMIDCRVNPEGRIHTVSW